MSSLDTSMMEPVQTGIITIIVGGISRVSLLISVALLYRFLVSSVH